MTEETPAAPLSPAAVPLDAVLERLGAFGRHQLLTLALISVVYATNSMYNVNYVFAVEDVGYRCNNPTCPDLNSSGVSLEPGPVKQCQYRPLGQCTNTSVYEQCTSWTYDEEHSFVAEFQLACQEWKQALVGTAHCFGSMLGLLFQGQISDRFGRKKAVVFAGTMGAVLGLVKSWCGSFWGYVATEAAEAAVGDALSPAFMLSIEIVPKRHAILYQMILLNCYTGGLILMSLLAWAVPYWRHFLRVIYAPTLIVLTYTLFLDDSVRWLFSKGRNKEAIALMKKIAKRNKVKIDDATLDKLNYIDEKEENLQKSQIDKADSKKLLLQTFKSKIMMRRFLVCMVWWFTITLINYGMMISSVLIAGNKYVNFAVLMLMDIPANVFYWLVLVNYKRKISLLTSFVVGGIFCIAQPFMSQRYAWLGLALFMLFEMLATFSYNIVYLYTSELFPTHSRNSMHALCSAVGRVGSLLAPQTPLLMTYWPGLPPLLFGATSLLSGLLVLPMPETADLALPDTVRQAEMIGNQRETDLFLSRTENSVRRRSNQS